MVTVPDPKNDKSGSAEPLCWVQARLSRRASTNVSLDDIDTVSRQ